MEPQPELSNYKEQFTDDNPSDKDDFHEPGLSKLSKCKLTGTTTYSLLL